MGVSVHDPDSWMVFNGTSYLNGCFGGRPILGKPHMVLKTILVDCK